MLETNHLRLSEWTETQEWNQNARKMEQEGTGMEKKREQHEKVVNNFMQIKGEQ